MFKCFPLPFCSRNLEQIDKRHCNLTAVPDDILRYTRTLEELLLDANQLQDLPKGVYRLTQLRRLTFSDNEIQRILPEIGQLVNLEELDCSRNDIDEIPENIRHCRSLQSLDFSGNPLANNLPSGIIHLRQLTQLILNDVSLAELPKEIGSLSNLRVLEVRENLLKILPDSLVQLIKLESLDLGSNVIEQLPNNIGYLQSLKELWLDSNELFQLPNDIGQLKRLQCLDVSENKLTYLPNEIGDLESLTNLELSSNQIEQIPISIGQLKQRLLILKINSNSLTKLCDEIGQCIALTELILTENALSELPKTIGNLINLTNLNIDRNQLTHLPVEIAGCESLGMLSLRDNRLTHIPSELSNLKHLHVLDLSGNRLLNLPCTLLDCDLKAIWLAENQAQPMLKFATDIDSNTGEKVLTCYLLPQQQYTTSSMENLLNSSKSQNEPVSRSSVQIPTIESDDERHERTGSVKFADQAEENKESSLQRHNTPHPKDLRARRTKIAKKFQTDGNLLHHDHQHPFQPNAHAHTDPLISSGNSLVQPNRTIPDGKNNPRESIDYIPPEISLDDDHHDSDDNDHDEQSGEQIIYIEKHVEFTEDLNTNEETKEVSNQQQKLHRRDTPHHLKNKRIINKNNDSITLDQIMSHSPTKSSIASAGKESLSPSIPSSTRPMTVHHEQISLTIHRPANTGLGISIAGGVGSSAYKDNDYGIFLTKVTEEGPASQAGLLVGDKLVSVNGISLINCEHSEAVSALKKAGDRIEMIVMREILQPSDDYLPKNENSSIKEGEKYSTIIQRDENQGGIFGFSIAGGNQTTPTNANENFYISKINNQEKSNSLAIGDRLLSINGHDTMNISHDQAIDIINTGGNNVQLTLYREKITNGNQNISTINIDNTVEEARVAKGNGPMGLSIVGGVDQACPPFGIEQRGVFVSKILPNGSASRTNLRIGDRILKVNNCDVSQATHLEAVNALLQATNEVVLLVRHEPQPAGLKEITLIRHSGEPLGIRINGGVEGKRVNPDDPEDDGIFVTEVKDGSPASGLLTVGTRILEVR
jgi:protein scribble